MGPLSVDEMIGRSLGGSDRTHEVPHWLANVIYAVLAFLCKVVFRYRVIGRENLRSLRGKTGVVLISNHASYLDVAHLWLASRPSQWPRFLAREGLFTGNRFLAWVFAHVGAFPVKRDAADRTAIKNAVRMLKNDELVGVFPEGTRRGKGSAKVSLHAGAAMIARMGKAPLLPATVRNVDRVKAPGEHLRLPRLTVVFGEPIELAEFDFLPKEERLDGCTWYLMRECFALSRSCAPEDVDMAELFPEAKDYAGVFAVHPIHPGARALAVEGGAAA